jgi:gamma-glutamylputrescine oxidase
LTYSYYEATAHRAQTTPPLSDSIRADVCVIGAGYTGLMAALELAERGHRAVVLEAGLMADGASGRNGGQLGSGQRRHQRWLEAKFGRERAKQYWRIAEDAKALAKRRIAEHRISCDLKPGILTAAHKPQLFAEIAAEAEHLQAEYGYDKLRILTKSETAEMLGTAVYHGGVLDNDAAHLHPLNYALGLARAAQTKGVVIYEKTRAISIDADTGFVEAERGAVEAQRIILACNGYLGPLVPDIAPHIMPINNYIVATEPLKEDAQEILKEDVAVADTRVVINYFRRSADGRLLFGGGESYTPDMPARIEPIVRRHLARVFPRLSGMHIDYAWGGTLAITPTRLPHIGRLGRRALFAHGYSGHGVGMAGMAGKLMAEAAFGKSEDFDLMAALAVPAFPGGTLLRDPLRVAAMIGAQILDAF